MKYHLILDICIVCNHVVYILSLSKEEKKGCQLEVGHTHVISHSLTLSENLACHQGLEKSRPFREKL